MREFDSEWNHSGSKVTTTCYFTLLEKPVGRIQEEFERYTTEFKFYGEQLKQDDRVMMTLHEYAEFCAERGSAVYGDAQAGVNDGKRKALGIVDNSFSRVGVKKNKRLKITKRLKTTKEPKTAKGSV